MEERTGLILTIDLSVVSEEFDDEWAFRVKELGFTLYADTKEEGPELVHRATKTLLDSFGHDNDALIRYLDNHSVLYQIKRAEDMLSSFGAPGGVVMSIIGPQDEKIPMAGEAFRPVDGPPAPETNILRLDKLRLDGALVGPSN